MVHTVSKNTISEISALAPHPCGHNRRRSQFSGTTQLANDSERPAIPLDTGASLQARGKLVHTFNTRAVGSLREAGKRRTQWDWWYRYRHLASPLVAEISIFGSVQDKCILFPPRR